MPNSSPTLSQENRRSTAYNAGGPGLLARWATLGILGLLGKVDLPRMYCAGQERLLYDRYLSSRRMPRRLAPHHLEEFEGFTHEWRFWDLTIQKR